MASKMSVFVSIYAIFTTENKMFTAEETELNSTINATTE